MGKICVLGSYNQDLTMYCNTFPQPKETVKNGTFKMGPGGKGANQADAAAKAGGDVVFIGKIGNDAFGDLAIQHFRDAGIDTQFVFRDDNNSTGCAVITVDKLGENAIIVASGANTNLLNEEVDRARDALEHSDIVLFQFETNLEAIERGMTIAHNAGALVCLNPAPMLFPFPERLFGQIDIFVPNEVEAGKLLGYELNDIQPAKRGVLDLLSFGLQMAIITMGSNGAVVATIDEVFHVPTLSVTPVDTTGAGDCFLGALAVALSEKQPLKEAITFANAAAALNVTRRGASEANPSRGEIISLLNNERI